MKKTKPSLKRPLDAFREYLRIEALVASGQSSRAITAEDDCRLSRAALHRWRDALRETGGALTFRGKRETASAKGTEQLSEQYARALELEIEAAGTESETAIRAKELLNSLMICIEGLNLGVADLGAPYAEARLLLDDPQSKGSASDLLAALVETIETYDIGDLMEPAFSSAIKHLSDQD